MWACCATDPTGRSRYSAPSTWAARQGRVATGVCEACYRNLMRAAAAEGNRVAFEATYRELLAVTDADQGPDASTYLDPETIDLHEQENPTAATSSGLGTSRCDDAP